MSNSKAKINPKNNDAKDSSSVAALEIMQGGKEYFERIIKIIDESLHVIYLQFYIFNNDTTGKLVLDALVRARLRHVEIFVVLDGVGSGHLPKLFINKFLDAGIQIRFFSKLRFSIPFRTGRRLHHKLLVVDYNKALIGGINIADKYHGLNGNSPWLDFGIYIEGPVCIKLHNIAIKILRKRNFKKNTHKIIQEHSLLTTKVNILENDFFRKKLEIRKSYDRAFKNVQHSLILFASYFLPSLKQLNNLEMAKARGVNVSLVLPKHSDIPFYNSAVKYLYNRLLEKGIKIYQYPLSVLHAKVAVADYRWCTIGSYNLNDLSDILSIELNIEVYDSIIVEDFQKRLEEIIELNCEEVDIFYIKKTFFLSRWISKIYYYGILKSLKLMYWFTDKNKEYQID